jgi:hypothetical protein
MSFSFLIKLLLGVRAAADNHACACKYDTGLPESFWKGGKYASLAMISAYGTACAPWDSIKGTPWFAGYCNTVGDPSATPPVAGKDYCSKADSWCDDPWCYVDKTCPTWTKTSVFADVPNAPVDMGYSYEACGAINCYADKNAAGCPYDPMGVCPNSCKCLYKDGLPKEFWEGGKYKDLAMISQYGVRCNAWDALPGTPWFVNFCDPFGDNSASPPRAPKNHCHRDNSWCAAEWCYVSASCSGSQKTGVFADADVPAATNLHFSYEACGAPNCYTDVNKKGCPYDPNGKCCQCKYANSGLPEAFWKGGKFESLPMISQYGGVCAPWDSIRGTPWYAGYCDTTKNLPTKNHSADYCAGASWCNDPWCYVDQDLCNSWVKTSVFKDVPAAPASLGYSYLNCNSLDCYSTPNDKNCPYDPKGDCKKLTCGDVKELYRTNDCCGSPAKSFHGALKSTAR